MWMEELQFLFGQVTHDDAFYLCEQMHVYIKIVFVYI